MKLNAYILAADPAWIEASVLSYYDVVGRIVVSYDHDGRGWTGASIDVEQCLRRLKAIDHQHKLVFSPGRYARSEYFDRPIESETYQRQQALDEASQDADWVIQLDTDEIIPNTQLFTKCILDADRLKRDAVTYPSRGYSHRINRDWFLEFCRRGWRISTGRQAPYALKSYAKLNFARRHMGSVYHVDCFNRQNMADYPHVQSADTVIAPGDSLIHLSWVRDEIALRGKFNTWGHAKDRNWNPLMEKWLCIKNRPLWSCFSSQFERGSDKWHLRPVRINYTLISPTDNSLNTFYAI